MIDWDRIDELVLERYISARKHRDYPLTIYNYTPKAAYSNFWEESTLICRGLVADDSRTLISRPFRKFFSLGQLGTTWLDEPYEIYDKLDGSMGVSIQYQDERFVATRGSFHSEQAAAATRILNTKYAHVTLDPSLTYCWEIILPFNRIVVNYGTTEDLILLAVFETLTGKELPLDNFRDLGFPLVKRYPNMSFAELEDSLKETDTNREGYVIRFESGVRIKAKISEYQLLHRLITQLTPRHIWEYLSTNQGFSDLVAKCPIAYQEWIQRNTETLLAQYQEIEQQCKADFLEILNAVGTPTTDERELRKQRAQLITKKKYPSVLFLILDGREYAEKIWREIYPESTQPFKVEE